MLPEEEEAAISRVNAASAHLGRRRVSKRPTGTLAACGGIRRDKRTINTPIKKGQQLLNPVGRWALDDPLVEEA